MSANEIGIGGYKEVIASVSGKDVFARLKFESGVHRVQRVPVTESGGRIHTSAATVAVMPEVEEVDVKIDESDLRIDVFRASGPTRSKDINPQIALIYFHIYFFYFRHNCDSGSRSMNASARLCDWHPLNPMHT